MLRDHVNKNSPRETYIVDKELDETEGYILIRKLNQTLRPRLYKALPQELIHSPHATHPIEVKYGRKKRKAATKALDKIRNSLNIVENPKPKFKYGWLEHDQDYEDDFITTYSHPIPHDNDDSSLASTQPSPEDTDATDSATSDSSNVDLVWDTSPIQYSLQASEDTLPNQVHNRPLQPLMSTSKELPPSFPQTRDRIDPSTDHPSPYATPGFQISQK